jgi:hypothetical protein
MSIYNNNVASEDEYRLQNLDTIDFERTVGLSYDIRYSDKILNTPIQSSLSHIMYEVSRIISELTGKAHTLVDTDMSRFIKYAAHHLDLTEFYLYPSILKNTTRKITKGNRYHIVRRNHYLDAVNRYDDGLPSTHKYAKKNNSETLVYGDTFIEGIGTNGQMTVGKYSNSEHADLHAADLSAIIDSKSPEYALIHTTLVHICLCLFPIMQTRLTKLKPHVMVTLSNRRIDRIDTVCAKYVKARVYRKYSELLDQRLTMLFMHPVRNAPNSHTPRGIPYKSIRVILNVYGTLIQSVPLDIKLDYVTLGGIWRSKSIRGMSPVRTSVTSTSGNNPTIVSEHVSTFKDIVREGTEKDATTFLHNTGLFQLDGKAHFFEDRGSVWMETSHTHERTMTKRQIRRVYKKPSVESILAIIVHSVLLYCQTRRKPHIAIYELFDHIEQAQIKSIIASNPVEWGPTLKVLQRTKYTDVSWIDTE